MSRIMIWVAVAAGSFAAVFAVPAAEDPVPPTNRPSPAELRTRAQRLTPEERAARFRELRGRLGPGTTNRSELERRREEWRALPPAEREAKIREFREQNRGGGNRAFNSLTPAERESKRTEIKERIEIQIRDLEARKATGTLAAAEERRLERFRRMWRSLDRGTALGAPNRRGNKGSTEGPEREGKDLPAPRPAPTTPPPANSPARKP